MVRIAKRSTPWKSSRLRVRVFFIVLLFAVLLLTGCSFSTEFVVVNKSDQPIEVRYRISDPSSDMLLVCAAPATTASANLDSRDEGWQKLSTSQFRVDHENRKITVVLNPDEALRITTAGRAKNNEQEISGSQRFCADQLEVSGAYGELRLYGAQVYFGFSTVSEKLRTLTYQR